MLKTNTSPLPSNNKRGGEGILRKEG